MPAIGLGTFAETLLVQFAIVDEVMLARNIKDLGRLRALNHLGRSIKLGCLRVLGNIAGMDHEVRRFHPGRNHVNLSIAFVSAHVTFVFAPLLKPM
jgi:hypothetical protein